MDFSKLSIEFSNLQNTISKYNNIVVSINKKIRENIKNINKNEAKLQKVKTIIEKEIINLYILVLKNENDYLQSLINESNQIELEEPKNQ